MICSTCSNWVGALPSKGLGVPALPRSALGFAKAGCTALCPLTRTPCCCHTAPAKKLQISGTISPGYKRLAWRDNSCSSCKGAPCACWVTLSSMTAGEARRRRALLEQLAAGQPDRYQSLNTERLAGHLLLANAAAIQIKMRPCHPLQASTVRT